MMKSKKETSPAFDPGDLPFVSIKKVYIVKKYHIGTNPIWVIDPAVNRLPLLSVYEYKYVHLTSALAACTSA